MGRSISIRVDESLYTILNKIQNEVVGNIKKVYNLNEVIVSSSLASQILAAKYQGFKNINLKATTKRFTLDQSGCLS
jgi:hypothetical protein